MTFLQLTSLLNVRSQSSISLTWNKKPLFNLSTPGYVFPVLYYKTVGDISSIQARFWYDKKRRLCCAWSGGDKVLLFRCPIEIISFETRSFVCFRTCFRNCSSRKKALCRQMLCVVRSPKVSSTSKGFSSVSWMTRRNAL